MQDIIINLGCISNAFPCIGFQGENEHRRIVFDAGEIYVDYPDAVVTMAIKPPVGEVYPKIVTRDGNNVIWSVTAADVAYPDNGAYQLTFTNGTEIIKTYVGIYSVASSIIGNGQPPKPVDDWLKEAQAMLDAFAEMTAEATTLQPGSDATVQLTEEDEHKVFLFGIPRGDTGNGIASCVLNADYTLTITFTDGNEYTTPSIRGAKGEPGKDGEDGFSPVVVVSEITGGHRVVITDAEGDHTFDVLNGEDGFDPVVVVTTITGGHRVTVTDASGSTSFDVMDGVDGTNGTSAYVWIRYAAAQPTQDSDMKTTPDAWMGVYSGSASSAPTHYTDYAWYNIKGATGEVSQAELDAVETELKSAINGVVEYPETVLHKTDFSESYDETYVNIGYINDSGRFKSSSNYRTYYYHALTDLNVYVTPTVDDPLIFVSVFNASGVAKANFVTRYDNNGGTWPTVNSRASISADQWVAVSYGYSSTSDRGFNLYTGLYSYTNIPTDAFVDNIIAKTYVGMATKTATSLTVSIDRMKFVVNKYNNATIRAVDLWRTNAGYISDKTGGYVALWSGSDSDGVVRIVGEDDFIGGYHGDETQTGFKLFIDGIEYNENSEFTNLRFNEIKLYCQSNVYHCNTSEEADTIAFVRNKLITFNNKGYNVSNYWVAQENVSLTVAYMGMLSIDRYVPGTNYGTRMLTGYHTNKDYKYTDSDTGTTYSTDITEVNFSTIYGDVGIKINNIDTSGTYYGNVADYDTQSSQRLKAYLDVAGGSSASPLLLNQGDALKASATTFIK